MYLKVSPKVYIG